MKLVKYIIILMVVLCGLSKAESNTTFEFDSSALKIDQINHDINYMNFKQTALGAKVSLPAKTYFVELKNNQSLFSFNYTVGNKKKIESLQFHHIYDDITTSDDIKRYEDISPSIKTDNLGQKAVQVIDKITIDNRQWAQLLIFPVTIDSSGYCYFNPNINLFIDSIQVRPERILTYHDIYQNKQNKHPSSYALSSNIDYIIITSALLQEPFKKLAQYKTSTGIKTEVKLIDDILASYNGRDDAEKLRNYLKQFYAEEGQYVLLGGDETQLPLRYAYPNNTSATPSIDKQQVCDLYFADVDGDWNLDNDNVWGEKYVDDVDLTPELKVGRLPFNTIEEVDNYVQKLINYETNPGNNDLEYLDKAFFFSSDQMRDFNNGGQHHYIALAYPYYFTIDTTNGVELSRGDDPSPYNLPANEVENVISQGYGIINILAHGKSDAFGVRTSSYNEWPKSYFTSASNDGDNGNFNDLTANNKTGFYYSLACDNGGFDMDQPPMNLPNPNLVATALGLPNAGAVAFVAYTRWGWVGTSQLLQKTFFDSLFAHPKRPAVEALYDTKAVYYYYRDQVYGLNYFGDPTLKVYTRLPKKIAMASSFENNRLTINVTSQSSPVGSCQVVISNDTGIIYQGETDSEGKIITDNLDINKTYTIAAIKSGYLINKNKYTFSMATDVNDDQDSQLPDHFSLGQNYPNPFNPSTTINFELPRKTYTKLYVYNLLGQTVKVLKDEILPAGDYTAEWNGNDQSNQPVASGVYFYRLETKDFNAVKKMVLIR
ncbi:MAG: T9SS type A sorting domain-containing protein [FCB group bacterium]|nr:T9SS type A sorting domain-containing protein [FCB group bacterium]